MTAKKFGLLDFPPPNMPAHKNQSRQVSAIHIRISFIENRRLHSMNTMRNTLYNPKCIGHKKSFSWQQACLCNIKVVAKNTSLSDFHLYNISASSHQIIQNYVSTPHIYGGRQNRKKQNRKQKHPSITLMKTFSQLWQNGYAMTYCFKYFAFHNIDPGSV